MSATEPGAGTAKKLMTADEFWDFVHRPENEDRDFDLIRGEVIELSRPPQPHGVVASLVAFELQLYARDSQGVCRLQRFRNRSRQEARQCGRVVGPDVAYFGDAQKFEDSTPSGPRFPPSSWSRFCRRTTYPAR
jgi:hypothetical protein